MQNASNSQKDFSQAISMKDEIKLINEGSRMNKLMKIVENSNKNQIITFH